MSVKNKSKVKSLFSKFRKSTTDLSEWNKHDEKLLRAIEDGDRAKAEAVVVRKAVLVTKLDPQGHTAFHRAAASGQTDIINCLISHGADTNGLDVQGRTALSCAARSGKVETLERLLMVNANHDIADHRHQTALHHACVGGSSDCVRLLLQYNANIDQPDKDGRSPLFYAAQMGFTSICKELIENNASINYRDNEKKTPLIVACEHGHLPTAELLVKKGANVLLTDDHGHNATWYATAGAHSEIKTVLDNAPMVASWDLGPQTTNKIEQKNEGDEVVSLNGVELQRVDSPVLDVTEGLPPEQRANFAVVPMSQFQDPAAVSLSGGGSTRVSRGVATSSSALVNYDDDEAGSDDDGHVAPYEQMKAADDMEKVQIVQQVRISRHSGKESTTASLPPPPPAPPEPDTSFTILPVVKVQKAEPAEEHVTLDAFKELEEEHEMVQAEMQRVTVENKRLQQQIEEMKNDGPVEQNNQRAVFDNNDFDEAEISNLRSELSELRSSLADERERSSELTDEVAALRKQLHDSDPKPESERCGGDDDWADSDEEDGDEAKVHEKVAVLRAQLHQLQAENTELKDKIQKTEHEGFYQVNSMNISSTSLINDLQDLSQLEAFQQAHESEVNRLQDEIKQLKAEISSLTCTHLGSSNDTTTIDDLKSKLEKQTIIINELESNEKTLKLQIKNMKSQEDFVKKVDCEEINSSLQSTFSVETGEAPSLESQTDLIEAKTRMSPVKIGYLQEISSLKAETQTLKTAIDKSKIEEKKYEEEVEQLKKEIESLVKNVNEQEVMELKYQNQIEKLKDELTNLGDSYVQVSETDDANKIEITHLKEELDEIHEKAERASEQLEIYQSQIDDLNFVIKELKEEKTAIKNRLANVQEELEESQTLTKELKEVNIQVQKQIPESAQMELKQLRERVVGLENEKSSLLGRVLGSDSSDGIELLKKENESLQCKLNDTEEELIELSKEYEEFSANYQIEVNEYKDELAKLTREKEDIEKEAFAVMEDEISQMAKRTAELEAEIEELQNQKYDIPDGYQKELEEAEEKILELKEKNLQLQAAPKTEVELTFVYENRIAELEEENERLENALAKTDSLKSTKSNEDNKEDDLHMISADNETLRKQLNDAASEQARLEAEKLELTEKFEELMQARNYMEQELENLHVYVSGLRSRSITPTAAALGETANMKGTLEDELQYLMGAIQNMRTQTGTPVDWTAINAEINTQLYEEVARVRNENNRLNEELEDLHEALDMAKQAEEKTTLLLSKQSSERHHDNDDENEAARQHAETLQDLATLNTELKRKLEQLQKENAKLSKENGQLVSENERMSSGNEHSEHEHIVENIEKIEVHQHARLPSSSPPAGSGLAVLSHQDHELKRLETSNLQLTIATEELTLEKKILENEIKHLKLKVEQAEIYNPSYVEGLLRDNQDLQSEIVHLKESLVSKQDMKISASSTSSSPCIDMSIESGYVKQCEILERETEKLKEDLSSTKQILSSQADELRDVSYQLKQLTNMKEKLEQENISLGVEVKTLEMEKDTVLKDLESAKHKNMLLEKDNKTSLQDIERLTTDKHKIEDINARLKNDIHSLQDKLHNMEKQHKTPPHPSREENNKLLDEYLLVQDEVQKTKEENRKLSLEVITLQNSVDKQIQESERIKRECVAEKEILAQKIKILDQNSKLTIKTYSKDDNLKDLQIKCQSLHGQVANLTRECDTLRLENIELRQQTAVGGGLEVERLQEENRSLLHQVEKLNEEMHNRSFDGESLSSNDIEQLQHRIYTLQSQLEAADVKHREIVSTYRTHLLAAVQGRIDPEVKQALLHIIKLRHSDLHQ